MTEIKRYNAKHFGDFEMVESNQGEWVRWEDVEKLQKSFIEKHKEVVDAITKHYCQLMSGTFSTNSMTCTLEIIEPPEEPNDPPQT